MNQQKQEEAPPKGEEGDQDQAMEYQFDEEQAEQMQGKLAADQVDMNQDEQERAEEKEDAKN